MGFMDFGFLYPIIAVVFLYYLFSALSWCKILFVHTPNVAINGGSFVGMIVV